MDEQVRLHEFSCNQNSCYENQCLASSPAPFPALMTKNISLLPNVTIKWKGNNRKIFTIIFMILQLWLTFVLLGKIRISKQKKSNLNQNSTQFHMEAKSLSFIVLYGPNTTVAEQPQQFARLPTQPTTISPTKANECLPMKASREDEFQQKLQNISAQATICLTVIFNNNSSWNLEKSSYKTDMVKELTFVGYVDMTHLSVIIERFDHAYKITFGSTSNQILDVTDDQYMDKYMHEPHTTEKYLLNLNEVIFENIDCKKIFEYFSKMFYMNAVRSLKIRNIVVDANYIMGMRQLLKQYKYSLEILEFTNVTWKVSLFDKISNQLPNLKQLHMDFVAPAYTDIEFLRGFNGANRLHEIVSMRGYLSYSQFASILKFKMLSDVTLGVVIPNNITTLNLFPVNKVSNLSYMELYLNFSNTSNCYLLSDYDIERPYVTKLNSNCDEDF